MNPFLWLILTVIDLYIWLLIASAVLSWLVAFNVVNTRNPLVANIGEFLYRITEPALRPIRNMLPNLGGDFRAETGCDRLAVDDACAHGAVLARRNDLLQRRDQCRAVAGNMQCL
jgi:YggT family protein